MIDCSLCVEKICLLIRFYLVLMFGNVQSSQPVGGNGGVAHEFGQPNYSLVAIRGRCGGAIDALQCLFVDINTGQFVESGRYGGNGGGDFEYPAPPGAWIDCIRCTTRSNVVASIQVQSSNGDMSREFGDSKNPQGQGECNAKGGRICGLKVRCGSLLDNVSFQYTR